MHILFDPMSEKMVTDNVGRSRLRGLNAINGVVYFILNSKTYI